MHTRYRRRLTALTLALTAGVGVGVTTVAGTAPLGTVIAAPPAAPPTRSEEVTGGGIHWASYSPGFFESYNSSVLSLARAGGAQCRAAEDVARADLDAKVQAVRNRNPGKVITVSRPAVSPGLEFWVHGGTRFSVANDSGTWAQIGRPNWYSECTVRITATVTIADPPAAAAPAPAPAPPAPPTPAPAPEEDEGAHDDGEAAAGEIEVVDTALDLTGAQAAVDTDRP